MTWNFALHNGKKSVRIFLKWVIFHSSVQVASPPPRILVQQVEVFTERVDPYDLEHKKPYLRESPQNIYFSLDHLLSFSKERDQRSDESTWSLRTERWAVSLGLVCGSCLRSPSMPEPPHVKFPLSFPLCLHSWPNVYLYLMVPGSSPKLSFFKIFCFLVVHYVLATTKLKFTFKWNKYGH